MREDQHKRERWQAAAAGIGGLTVLGIVGIPGVIMAVSPAIVESTEREAWARIGMLEEFPLEQTVLVEFGGEGTALAKRVYVRRVSPNEVVVISRACTDLSCPVSWDDGSACFFCPCHGGIFDAEGEPMAGPPSRPLYRYAVRIRAGAVEIDLASVPPMS